MAAAGLHLRIARPVRDLERAATMYVRGLGLAELGRFDDHDGFDGVMLGADGLDYHLELTRCREHPVVPEPTPEDLLVFYVPDPAEWRERCARLLAAGFVEVAPFNPYWGRLGRTFADPDGYRVVLQQADWVLGRLLARLADMPRFLEEAFAGLAGDAAAQRAGATEFSPVEQCWHLADLEREGYAERIRRLRTEDHPALPDFDGARRAQERRYRTLSLAAGLAAFREAREANLAALRAVAPQEWERCGTQEGVGAVTLADIPRMMAGHDAGHREEIAAWLRAQRLGQPAGPANERTDR